LNYFDSHITKNGRDNIKDRVNERLSKIEAQVEKLPFSKLK
jgi:hypothetical protein